MILSEKYIKILGDRQFSFLPYTLWNESGYKMHVVQVMRDYAILKLWKKGG